MAYAIMKRIIGRGGYDAADMRAKLNAYHDTHRMTDVQYQELCGMLADTGV